MPSSAVVLFTMSITYHVADHVLLQDVAVAAGQERLGPGTPLSGQRATIRFDVPLRDAIQPRL